MPTVNAPAHAHAAGTVYPGVSYPGRGTEPPATGTPVGANAPADPEAAGRGPRPASRPRR